MQRMCTLFRPRYRWLLTKYIYIYITQIYRKQLRSPHGCGASDGILLAHELSFYTACISTRSSLSYLVSLTLGYILDNKTIPYANTCINPRFCPCTIVDTDTGLRGVAHRIGSWQLDASWIIVDTRSIRIRPETCLARNISNRTGYPVSQASTQCVS